MKRKKKNNVTYFCKNYYGDGGGVGNSGDLIE